MGEAAKTLHLRLASNKASKCEKTVLSGLKEVKWLRGNKNFIFLYKNKLLHTNSTKNLSVTLLKIDGDIIL